MKLNVEHDRLVVELEGRDSFVEKVILSQKNPESCVYYAEKVIKDRWKEAESILIEDFKINGNIDQIWNYVCKVVRGRWEEVENFIAPSQYSFEYASKIVKGRWDLGEVHFVNSLELARSYSKILKSTNVADSDQIIENALLKGVEKLIENKSKNLWRNPADTLYDYCVDIRRSRWPEAEHIIAQSNNVLIYAKSFVREKWPIGEPYILDLAMKSSFHLNPIIDYSTNVLKDRWPEAEPQVLTRIDLAYGYAKCVVKGRWKEGEEVICKDPKWAYAYALNIIMGRWEEAEIYIADSFKYSYEYAKNIIKSKLPESMHNMFMMKAADLPHSHKDYEYVKKYFMYKKYKKEVKRRKPVKI